MKKSHAEKSGGGARGVFVTATDTGAGKTYFSAALLSALRREGVRCAGLKPFCCGGREDVEALAAATGQAVEEVNPFWYRSPAAPMAAAMIEGRPPDLGLVREAFGRVSARAFTVVEGAGGWLVPVTRDYFIGDLAVELGLPVVMVVPNRLGVLNHSLLTAEAIRRSGARLLGWVLNEPEPPDKEDPARVTNPALLEELLGMPPLVRIEFAAASIPVPEEVRRLVCGTGAGAAGG